MKQLVYFLLLSIFLASCANASTPLPNVTATFTTTPTSVTPTEVQFTPTKALTEIQASPTLELSAPEITMEQIKDPTKLEYHLVTEVQIADLKNSILNGPSKLDISAPPVIGAIETFPDGGINFRCTVTTWVSIAPWYPIKLETPEGPIDAVMYELLVSINNKSTRVVMVGVEARVIASMYGSWESYTRLLEHFTNRSDQFWFRIPIISPASNNANKNPIAPYLRDVIGKPRNADRQRLEAGVFDGDMWDTFFG